jgi:hypothetical protein
MVVTRRPGAPPDSFREFSATELFCGRCRVSQPVRERLLLVLPDGELYEYLCTACGAPVGSRKATAPTAPLVIAS